ncbi:hypothetical protein ACFQQB_40820 [Nonomuraea rubra]|uniref:hypothetical protein n=1 Tax=Nonomuraea rubra TaxID=46180 RepID=UPI00360C1855
MTSVNAQGLAPWQDAARTTEERVESLLAELTLEEKVAQLGAVWIQSDEPGNVAPCKIASSWPAAWRSGCATGSGTSPASTAPRP